MTNEEAFREVLNRAYRNTDDFEMHISKDCYKLIIEALEKQIPKKITHEATLQRCATCPTCKNVLDKFIEFIPGQPKIRVTFTNCHFCGQALDWSDNNA